MTEQDSTNRGYSVESVDDEYWPAQLVIRGIPVAKFESTALAQTVSSFLNREYFPSRRQQVAEVLASGGLSLLSQPNLDDLGMPGGA